MYLNTNTLSVIHALDCDDQAKAGFFYLRNEEDAPRAKQLLQDLGQNFIAQAYVKGRLVLIADTTRGQEALLKALQEKDGSVFEPVREPPRSFLKFLYQEGWKVRGGSSVIGQSMTLLSAMRSVSKENAAAGMLTPKFEPSTGAFAILNLIANGVNWIFGGQKEEDTAGLQKFDQLIADEINRHQPGAVQPVSATDMHKISYMSEEERAQYNKENSAVGLLRKHSVRFGEVGLRTAGSFCLMFNYRKIIPALGKLLKGQFAEAFKTAKTEDSKTFLAGCGMMIGKTLGLCAQTYDPNNPPTSYIGELRQKVFWIASSWTEMFAQSMIAYDRFTNKRFVYGGKHHADYVGGVGNIILTVPPYPTRLVLPYGEKVLDVDEIQARLLDALPNVPTAQAPGVIARLSARMDEHMGEKSPGFAKLYTNMVRKYEAHRPTQTSIAADATSLKNMQPQGKIDAQTTHLADQQILHKAVPHMA